VITKLPTKKSNPGTTRPRSGTAPSDEAYGNNAQDLDVFRRNFS